MANSSIDHAFTARSKTGASLEPTYAGALSFMRRKYTKDVKGGHCRGEGKSPHQGKGAVNLRGVF
jgi:hypothetical protein